MNKICKNITLQLPDYIEGKIGDDDRHIIQEHIQACVSCRKEAEHLGEAFTSLASERAFSAPSDSYWNTIVPRIHARLEEQRDRSRFMPGWVYRVVLPLATASIAIVLLIRSGVFSTATSQEELRSAVRQMTDEESAALFHEFTATVSENYDEYTVGDSLFVPLQNDVTEAIKSGVLEYTLIPSEHQFAPETLLESLSPEEIEQVLAKLQTQQNITS